MATAKIDTLGQELRHYQAKIKLCFRSMPRESALKATEATRRVAYLIKQAQRVE